jgi:hypothetical protein
VFAGVEINLDNFCWAKQQSKGIQHRCRSLFICEILPLHREMYTRDYVQNNKKIEQIHQSKVGILGKIKSYVGTVKAEELLEGAQTPYISFDFIFYSMGNVHSVTIYRWFVPSPMYQTTYC